MVGQGRWEMLLLGFDSSGEGEGGFWEMTYQLKAKLPLKIP